MIPLKMAIPEVFDHNLLEVGDENSTIIYCDMDGVLVDFDEGFKKISGGISAEQFDATGRSPEISRRYLSVECDRKRKPIAI